MYDKHISFIFGITTVYGIIFYQVYLLPWITIPPPFFCGIMVVLCLADGSLQHIYQGMQRYGVIGLQNINWINMSDNIINNSICIIFLRIMYMVSIKEDIITNPPFQFSGPSLGILSVSRNVGFGDTRQVSSIGHYPMCSEN